MLSKGARETVMLSLDVSMSTGTLIRGTALATAAKAAEIKRMEDENFIS